MGHVVRNEPWGVVDLDTDRGHVFVRQDWQYHWNNDSDVPPWTMGERNAFHHAVDRLIWMNWSFRTRFEVRAITDAGARQIAPYSGRGLTISFDVRRVWGAHHWHVHVQKVNPDRHPRQQAKADFTVRRMRLFSTDVMLVRAARFFGDPKMSPRPNFYVAPHEFGHALGYGYSRGDGEEYEPSNRYYEDLTSVMNIGREVRPRHVRLIAETLAQMVPGAQFTATVIQ